MTAPAKIGWGLVNYGPIWAEVYTSHLRAAAYASRTLTVEKLGGLRAIAATARGYIHSNENLFAQECLNDPEMTHLFLTESDMILPDDTLPKLLAVGQPIVSGVYFLRNGWGQPCLYKKTLKQARQELWGVSPVSIFPEHQPFRLQGCPGVGCVLIAREVFETMAWPWFDLKEGAYGSDIYFYTQALKAGFEVWCEPAVLCGQIDYHVWDVRDYHQRLQEDPEFAQHGFIIGTSEEVRCDIA